MKNRVILFILFLAMAAGCNLDPEVSRVEIFVTGLNAEDTFHVWSDGNNLEAQGAGYQEYGVSQYSVKWFGKDMHLARPRGCGYRWSGGGIADFFATSGVARELVDTDSGIIGPFVIPMTSDGDGTSGSMQYYSGPVSSERGIPAAFSFLPAATQITFRLPPPPHGVSYKGMSVYSSRQPVCGSYRICVYSRAVEAERYSEKNSRVYRELRSAVPGDDGSIEVSFKILPHWYSDLSFEVSMTYGAEELVTRQALTGGRYGRFFESFCKKQVDVVIPEQLFMGQI